MSDAVQQQQPSRRAKHRKEVKRYFQRQQNRALRNQAQNRDSQLFLFEGGGHGGQDGNGASKADKALAVTAGNETKLTSCPGAQPQVHAPVLLKDRPDAAVVEERGDEKPVVAVVAEPVSHAARRDDGLNEDVYPTATFEEGSPHRPLADTEDSHDDWNFDFVFRSKQRRDSDLFETTADGAGHCTHENAIVPSSFYAEMSGNEESESTDGEPPAAYPEGNTHSLVPRHASANAPAAPVMKEPPRRHGRHARQPSTEPTLKAAFPVASGIVGAPPKVPNSIHVRRVEGVPALPVEGPLPQGTDMNMPTSNYLTMDPTYNIHQHVPGFVRNQKVAMRSLLTNAFVGWKDVRESTLVLSTGEAMRTVFQQAYTEGKPLALKVQKIGPTLIVDTHGEQPSNVREMRARALLGKVLYRMEDALAHPTPPAAAMAAQASPSSPPATGAVTLSLAPRRVGAVATASKSVNRFSQTLRWDIDGLDVLVGVDTPIVLDRRSNTEQMIKLEDVSEGMSPSDLQRDALNCWFDATLANVPQVGIYIHNAGVVQRFEVKKVQELLGLVEGRIATVAMNFTSNVLQWLVTQCVKDNGSYAVFRNFDEDYLELYELPGTGTTNPLADLMDDGEPPRPTSPSSSSSSWAADGEPATPGTREKAKAEKQKEYAKIHLNLARMCFGMGQHLYREGAAEKAQYTIDLLLRSFAIFLQQPEATGSVDRVDDISGMLPSLVGRLLRQRRPSADVEAPPEAFRDALVTCGRFESRLRQALASPTLDPMTQRRYVRCLLPCSAALCVVVARTLDAFNTCRCECASSGRPVCRGRQCVVAAAEPSDVDRTPCGPAKDLLQVVVESLVHLEQLNEAVSRFVTVQQQQQQQQQQHPRFDGDGDGDGDGKEAERTGASRKHHGKRRTGKGGAGGRGASGAHCGTVMDPTTDVDLASLNASLAELFGDLVLLTMSDKSTFTAQVLKEVSRRIMERDAAAAALANGSRAAGSQVVATNPPASTQAPTTLQWIASLPIDSVSLSFTALRFYAKAGPHTRRLLLKTGQVYFLVGRYYARKDRYTKALEALHRAKSFFRSSEAAHDDACFGECFCSTPLVTLPDVFRALGDVYARVAELKLRASAAVSRAATTPHQPLSISAVHVQSEEEREFLRRAMASYAEGGWYRQRGVMVLRYVGAEIDTTTLLGSPADAATAQHLHTDLSELKAGYSGGDRPHQLLWEWEILRLYTCTAAGGAPAGLVEDAMEVARAWGHRLSGNLMIVGPDTPRAGAFLGGSGTTAPCGGKTPPPPAPAPCPAVAPSSSPPAAAASSSSPALAPPEKAQVATVPFDKGFTVPLVEQNLQLGVTHCVAAETADSGQQQEGLLRHTRLALTRVDAALDLVARDTEDAAAAHLTCAARVWGTSGATELVTRLSSMVAVRTLKAVVASVGATEATTEEATRILQSIATDTEPLMVKDPEAARQRLRAQIAPALQW